MSTADDIKMRLRRALGLPIRDKSLDGGIAAVFGRAYAGNHWRSRESRSGTGSDLAQTQSLRAELPPLFARYGIRSLLDIPCGDFNWMRHVDLTGIDYVGADVVPALVEANRAAYARAGVRFEALDLTADPLPGVDAILCRDCMVHLSYADIDAAFRAMSASGARFVLLTTFAARDTNHDIPTGHWRPLNLLKPPFSLPEPGRADQRELHRETRALP